MELKELYEKKGNIVYQMKDMAKQIDKATDTAVAKEKREQFDKWDDELEELNEQIRVAKRAEELAAIKADPVDPDPVPAQKDPKDILKSKEYSRALENQLRFGVNIKSEDKDVLKRANQFYTTDAKGGYTIDEVMANQILAAKVYFGGMLDKSLFNWITTKTGGTFNLPAVNDTSNEGYVIAEKTDMGSSAADMTFTNITLGAYKYTSGLVKVSNELLQDSEFNFLGWLGDQLAIRYWRGLNTLFTTGSGSSTLTGIVTGATKGEDATVRGITRDDILNLLHSVDPAYRNSPFARFMFNDSTLKSIKALAIGSADARPLWQVSMKDGEPDKIEGKPYIINQAMEDLHPTYKPVLFGDFKQFIIREVLPMKVVRLDELYAATDEVGYVLLGRYDSKLGTASSSNPVKFIRNATT